MAPNNTLVDCGEENLIAFVREARQQLVVIAPGLSKPVAEAVAERWQALGPSNVSVTLDDDSDHIRTGLGSVESLELLHRTAAELSSAVVRLRNSGITVVVSDDRSLIVPSTAIAVLKPEGQVNAASLDQAVFKPVKKPSDGAQQAVETIQQQSIDQVKENLRQNPPLPRQSLEFVKVFDAHFQFVELELKGTAIERKTVPIPAELLGLTTDDDIRNRMRASFKLVSDADRSELSGQELAALKKKIMDECLIHLPGYGSVVLRSNRGELDQRINGLRVKVGLFRKSVEGQIKDNASRLRTALFS